MYKHLLCWTALLALVLSLAPGAPIARAQQPRLWLYMSASASDVAPDTDLSFTLSGYVDFATPTPITMTVDLPDSLDATDAEILSTHEGIACATTARQAVCTAQMEYDRPLTMAVRAHSKLRAALLAQVAAAITGGGGAASTSVHVRVDHRNIYLPLMVH